MPSDLTLTASETQARALRRSHNLRARDHGATVWLAPQILSLDQYLRQRWLASWPAEQLLSASQELCLWHDAVDVSLRADSTQEAPLIGQRTLARQFMQTALLASRWSIDPTQGPLWTAEQKLFRAAFLYVEAQLKARSAISLRQLPQAFIDGLNNATIDAPPRLDWRPLPGVPVPYQSHVLHALRERDCTIQTTAPQTSAPPALQCMTSADDEAMWLSLGQRLLQRLGDNPQQTLLVAVPRLDDTLQQRISSAWQQIFAAEILSDDCSGNTPLWGFQRSPSLAQHPAVDLALKILELKSRDNRFQTFSNMLLHPLLFRGQWRDNCATIEVRLRNQGTRHDIGNLLRQCPDDAPDDLREHLQQLYEAVQAAPGRARALDWLSHWRRCWLAVGYHTSGAEWPLREEFDQVLLEFAGLDASLGDISQNEATAWLTQICQRQRYQPEGARDAPIQVCELSDALDQAPDHLYMADMHARAWPPPARPDPFLRLEDQISAGLPMASANGQLQHARDIWQALLKQHPHAQIWCPLSNSQGAECHPSPLISGSWTTAERPRQGVERKAAQWPENDPAPPLSSTRQRAQTGAVSIVQAQAHGGFFAFARHRLKLRALERPLEGLSPLAQGNWIHHVLQTFWQQHRCQSALLALDDTALLADLTPRVAAGASDFVPLGRYGRQLQAAESDRVLRCCFNWLTHEKRRRDDFEVMYCEASLDDRIGPLEFRMRIDRIDRCLTPHGPRYLVIDYKTGGGLEERFWRTHQFYEPQLPLYATSDRLVELDVPHVDGICFAQVDETHPAFIASLNWRRKLIEDDTKTFHVDWEDILQDWRTRLSELVGAFCTGSVEYDANQDYRRRYPVADLLTLIDQANEDDDA
ncbi:MAG: hypothetical protein EVA65_03090 [Oceanococcus sp.]|nr:MAG: hypothetical protein EVA65_03090 [Oceanococcus sp.]